MARLPEGSPSKRCSAAHPYMRRPCHLRSFLRRLTPEQGVRLEFWRSARSLHGAARQYGSLARLGQGFKFVPLRFEVRRRRPWLDHSMHSRHDEGKY